MKILNREKLLILVAIAVVGVFAGDWLVFTPLVGLWKKRTDRITELTKQYNQGLLLLQREQALTNSWEHIRTNALPANTAAGESLVLQAVDRWAQASRMTLTSLKPQWRQAAKEATYSTLDCEVDGSGDIQALARFVYELEKDPMALKVEDLKISARDDNGQKLALSVRFSGLRLNLDKP